MSAEELLTLGLRFTGFWVLVSAVESTAYAVAMISMADNAQTDIVVEVAVTTFAEAALAAIFLLYARALASCFYGGQAANGRSSLIGIGLRDVYQVAARVLGVFALFSAIKPLSNIISAVFVPSSWEELSAGSWFWAYCVQATTYVLSGLFLIFCASKLAALFVMSHETKQNNAGNSFA
jgi:hypothetical protein